MPPNVIEILRTNSLPSLLEQEIEKVILSGELAPGARINEKEFALRFGISRGPIREALRALEAGGLVEQIPNYGAFVRHLNVAQAADVYEVRAVLFGLAGRLLAGRIQPAQKSRLLELLAEMDEAADRDETERYLGLNFAFHEYIVREAGNEVLANQYLGLVKQLRLYRARNLMLHHSLAASNAEHRTMVDAIIAGDGDAAAAAHARHVLLARERLTRTVPEGQEAITRTEPVTP